jgi:hypothetical protein
VRMAHATNYKCLDAHSNRLLVAERSSTNAHCAFNPMSRINFP